MKEQDYPFPHISPVWSRYSDLVIVRGEGAYLYDEDDNAYLDFTTGIGVTNTAIQSEILKI